MSIILAFAPFIVFALGHNLVGVTGGLIAGAVVSAGLLVWDRINNGGTLKVLEVGTLILFAGLALYAVVSAPAWSIVGVRLLVDMGLLLIVLVSIAARRPFTLQYARQKVGPEYWNQPLFIRTNYVISSVWALAFAVLVAADLIFVYVPDVPPRVGIVVTIAALVGAVKFTGWYPERQRSKAVTPVAP